MNQAGKPAEAVRPDKRERRRGAAGRAAALRRAPSDSDCSGETASLSADSGDRAPRPAPLAPPRSGKTRSRRRGSEWEVLEGLKDGQRFEKRPDVYNGYLHKKRKWPLKGWHKRFFVIDAGILVYARSPTDVARGRLHGSVDVGLSVISAKARRRRIDIDADEFIYHLRAKTPDVFRTWLNVLKAHRLYRQHLLTFGARESIPKIQGPLEDLPATDTSSRTSNDASNTKPEYLSSPLPTLPIDLESSEYTNKDKSSIFQWQLEFPNSISTFPKNSLIPLNFTVGQDVIDKYEDSITHNHRSTCSIKYLPKDYKAISNINKKSSHSSATTLKGKQRIGTDLEFNSFENVTVLKQCILNAAGDRLPNFDEPLMSEKSHKKNHSLFFKPQDVTVRCFLTHWKKQEYYGTEMRRSRKCTNLPKYRNESQEPPLDIMPSSKCLLLRKYRLTEPKQAFTVKTTNKAVGCKTTRTQNIKVQVKLDQKNSEKNISTISIDKDEITSNVIVSILNQNKIATEEDIKYCLDHVFKDLYDNHLNYKLQPVKNLFRNLLEYWLKNKTVAKYKEVMNCDKWINNQSERHFTRDKNMSGLYLEMNSKETQCDVLKVPSTNHKNDVSSWEKRNSALKLKSSCSFRYEKESQEKLLKNTVYVCEKTEKSTSKGINTYEITATEEIDPGKEYLKDILSAMCPNIKKIENTTDSLNIPKLHKNTVESKHFDTVKNDLRRSLYRKDRNDLVYENYEDNSLVIDITKYNIENISVFNDPQLKGLMSITIKLKEKYVEAKPTHLNLTFSDDSKYMTTDIGDSVSWLSFLNHDVTASDGLFTIVHKNSDMGFSINSDTDDFNPYISSDGTSKTHIVYESDSHFGKTINRNDNINNISSLNKKASQEPQACYIVSFKKENTAKLPPQKDTKISECLIKSRVSPNQSPGTSKPYKSEVQKAAPKIIDEKFILLLLENLTLLSKNVPSLHKDLETFYLKLKKRHEKMVKKCNIVQGLSLLGKIYRKDLCIKDSDDQESFDPDDANKQREFKTAATNTETHEVENKSVYACISRTAIDSDVLSTDNIDRKTNGKVEANSPTSCEENMPQTIGVEATLSPIPIRKKNAINTDAKCILNENTGKVPIEIARDSFKNKRNSQKMRQELIKEISLLSPSNKVSTHSIVQQEITSDHKPFDKDFHVCRLFGNYKYKVKRTHSTNVSSSEDTTSDEMRTLYRCPSDPSFSGLYSPTTPTLRGPQAGFVSGTPGGRLAGWIIESGGPLETASRELGQAQLSVQQLQRLLDALDTHHQLHHDTDVSVDGASPNVKKDRRKFGLRKKKSNSKCASVELAPPHIDPSSSHTALSSLSALTAPPSPGGGASSIPNSAASLPIACAAARPQSLPGAESLNTVQGAGPASLTSLTPDHQLREDFTVLAKDLVASLKGIVSTMVCERGRLRAAMEAAESSPSPAGAVVAALRTNLNSALQQNSELRSRLSRIHDTSDIADITAVHNDAVNRHMQQSLSFSSSCVSASEFFDAEEHEEDDDLKPDDVIAADEAGVIELDGDSSSEAGSLSSEDGSASSDNSDGAMVSAEQALRQNGGAVWTRRTRLPAPRPEPGGPSLWNLLYKNIGKDLSQISMPVTINEPLNMLQRLCEELEYSELLDSAAECTSAMERMSLIAAFAVSAYAASAHRAASKPFNPLLAETYECVRDDRGFRFLAEQVSHHPPISACHAESSRWCFWQEARIKTKFWGKSMEFQPTGRVHVRLNTTGDHYTWNKVTTCVHNLFGGQRWVDQYGDMHIVCVGTDLSCKLNFVKASSWSQSRHEVRGAVTCGGARLRVAGRWSEALYVGEPPAARCLWRPGAMPPEHELYYGFTRFAMELNELEPGMKDVLPHTDTRLRPDQRALEEGDVETAEQLKHSLEQAQRDRRRESPAHSPAWFRKTIEEGEETWVFSGEYWKARAAGFSDDIAPRIW